MSENEPKQSLSDRFRWWLYSKCFAYCVWCMHPEADPSEFSILDEANFAAISKDEILKLIVEAPEIAWRFDAKRDSV
jgi:hypothetical protein